MPKRWCKRSCKSGVICLLLLLLTVRGYSQLPKGMSIEATLHAGRIYKHTPKLIFDVNGISKGIEINVINQKYGKKIWHQQFFYPKFGLALFYYNFGDREVFGQSVGVFPNVILPVFRIGKVESSFQLGWGLAYLTKYFNPINNPTNNAVSSRFSSLNTLKWQLAFPLNSQWTLNMGASFTHFSNGAASLPNFGINIPAVSLGAIFTPQPLKESDFVAHEAVRKRPRFGFSAHFDLAFKESQVAGGPRYPFYIASIAGIYRYKPGRELSLGIDYEYNKSRYVIGLHNYDFNSEAAARKVATRLGVSVGHEFLLGNVGLLGRLGTYLPGYNKSVGSAVYSKLAMRYYFPEIGQPKTRFYVGLYLKAHRVTAEYMALGLGASF